MKHSIIFKDEKSYASFPLIDYINGTLTVAFFVAPVVDHCGIYDWVFVHSEDEGETWSGPQYSKSSLSPRELYDSYWGMLPSGEIIRTGSMGWRMCPKKDKKELKKWGLVVYDHQENKKKIIVGRQSLYVMVEKDGIWYRKIWAVPNIAYITTFPRPLEGCTRPELILLPAYAITKDRKSKNMIWRSDDYVETWELINMFPHNVAFGNEMAFIEVGSKILALIRSDTNPQLMESWSSDYGRTWSYPLYISIIGGPPHLLKVEDKILCTYGYRGNGAFINIGPDFNMGIRARMSENGRDWSEEIILRDDGGTPSRLHKKRPKSGATDIGYPVSVQLSDNSIFTVYYITLSDGVTHIASTKWNIEEESK